MGSQLNGHSKTHSPRFQSASKVAVKKIFFHLFSLIFEQVKLFPTTGWPSTQSIDSYLFLFCKRIPDTPTPDNNLWGKATHNDIRPRHFGVH